MPQSIGKILKKEQFKRENYYYKIVKLNNSSTKKKKYIYNIYSLFIIIIIITYFQINNYHIIPGLSFANLPHCIRVKIFSGVLFSPPWKDVGIPKKSVFVLAVFQTQVVSEF